MMRRANDVHPRLLSYGQIILQRSGPEGYKCKMSFSSKPSLQHETEFSSKGPLAESPRVRILDLTRILAGPWATQLLADYGAEIIKVEKPGRGDDTRVWGSSVFHKQDAASMTRTTTESQHLSSNASNCAADSFQNASPYFLCANRGKMSIAVDISKAKGQAIIRELVKTSDVLVENYKCGTLKRYGLDFESILSINPGIIYCSITGFGHTGPMKMQSGYDAMIQAMCGLMSITGVPDGLPGAGPQKVGVAVVDLMTGMYASTAILAALHRNTARRLQGMVPEPEHIDISLLDTGIALLANQSASYLATGVEPQRYGNAHPTIAPYQTFSCSDGKIMVAVGNDDQFNKLAMVVGAPDVLLDKRFKTNNGRVAHRDALIPLLDKAFYKGTSSHWVERLVREGISCSPINTIPKALRSEQVNARAMLRTVSLPSCQDYQVTLVDNPVKFKRFPNTDGNILPPPMLGEHTVKILRNLLGYTNKQINELIEENTIQVS